MDKATKEIFQVNTWFYSHVHQTENHHGHPREETPQMCAHQFHSTPSHLFKAYMTISSYLQWRALHWNTQQLKKLLLSH